MNRHGLEKILSAVASLFLFLIFTAALFIAIGDLPNPEYSMEFLLLLSLASLLASCILFWWYLGLGLERLDSAIRHWSGSARLSVTLLAAFAGTTAAGIAMWGIFSTFVALVLDGV